MKYPAPEIAAAPPLGSVIVVNLNGGAMVREALRSALAQSVVAERDLLLGGALGR